MHSPKILVAICMASLAGGCVYLNSNFRVVEQDRLYRSGQMGSQHLERTLVHHGVRTVISLRGADPLEAWYQEELSVCQTLGVTHHDVPLSKNVLPTPESLHRLIALLKDSAAPILVHCQGGTHRSAVASAVYLLLEGAEVEEARRQLGAFFNDAPIGELLDLYESSQGPDRSSQDPFEEWAKYEYPDEYDRRTTTASPSP